MKKGIIITAVVLLTFISGIVSYFVICGGKPYIENFKELSDDYETIANTALDYYKNVSPEEEFIIINLNDDNMIHNNQALELTNAQKEAVKKT